MEETINDDDKLIQILIKRREELQLKLAYVKASLEEIEHLITALKKQHSSTKESV